jgi:hypothetical protein
MMQFELRSSAKKCAVLAVLALLTASYVGLSAAQMLAAYFSQSFDPVWLKRAVSLDPGNAEVRHQLGRYELLARQSPQTALPWLESAAALNPHSGRYWTDLAVAQQSLGQIDGEKRSLQSALEVESHTTEIAWDAANLFLAQGSTDEAMKQFHSVMQNDSVLMWPAIRTCWKIRPEIDYLLDNVFPPQVHSQLLGFLILNKETAAAEKVWQRMFAAQQPIDRQDLFGYVRYLVLQHEPVEAARVWQEAAGMAALQAYEPSPENLIVNGDFGLEILNGGFDWVHQKADGVFLELDPIEAHSSSRSLRITFDGPGIVDAGISEVVAVEPNTSYEFSAFYKARDMDGAGGMQFAVQDAYKETSLFMSEDLRDADFWKRTGGSFTTGPETRLLVVRMVRVPSGSPIRGRLWIDGLRLVPAATATQMAATSAGKDTPWQLR